MILALLSALAAAPAADYAPCSHRPDQPGPLTTFAEQAAVEQAIRAKVEQLGGSPVFARYLIAVATRESSLRPGVIHVGDTADAAAAYKHTHKAHHRARNPYADRPELWLSYGLFGMNSNYYARVLHPFADPRMLCDLDFAVETYAVAAGRAMRKMSGCVELVLWSDIHRAIQGGDICPDGRRQRLPTRLARLPVTRADLGLLPSGRGSRRPQARL